MDDILATIGPRPEGMSLERIDNDGNYEPGKVKWATQTEQIRNRRPIRKRGQSSQYRGVRWDYNRWAAYASKDRKSYSLGRYLTEEGAARAFDRWALQHHGSNYKGFNFPEEVIKR